jgi:hypothetical protein
MGIFTNDTKTMDDLFLHQLEDIYYTEQQLESHSADGVTGDQRRPEGWPQVARNRYAEPDRTSRQGVRQAWPAAERNRLPSHRRPDQGSERDSGEIEDKAVLDAAIVANSQAVEHYEISRYGTLKAWAEKLGLNDAASLLDETLEEEKNTDEALTELAEAAVNQEASQAAE